MSSVFTTVLMGSMLLGAVSGLIGTFALLRRQSLMGDALAHAALPGVCLAFLLTHNKEPLTLLVGAIASGLLGSLAVLTVIRGSRVKEDAAIGMVLSVFFGLGIVLLTWIQKLPFGNQSGLDHFLFGQAATLMRADIVLFSSLGLVVTFVMLLFYKELKLLSFDSAYGSILGFRMRALEMMMTLLLVIVVVIGLQTVGVVLMVAALITPAAAARQWTERLGFMLLLSAGLGAVSSMIGVTLSGLMDRLPTGPMIVLVSSAFLMGSLLFAPKRGAIGALLRNRKLAARIRRENLLKDLYLLGERQADWQRFISFPLLMGIRGQGRPELARTIAMLDRLGYLDHEGDLLRLSPTGKKAAQDVVRRHRVWELYLNRRLALPPDHVHRDAEAMEHVLSNEDVARMEESLGYPLVDPHGQPIPPRGDTMTIEANAK